jgi:hypothetical protein
MLVAIIIINCVFRVTIKQNSMKKFGIYSMAILMLGISTLSSGCMGSWVITKKLYSWNEEVSENKFINQFVFWAFLIIPVYSISLVIDYLVLNLIEFWTGSNPVAMAPGEKETGIVKGKDGNEYEITVTQNRYDIVTLTGANKGEKTAIVFIASNKTWSVEKDGVTNPIATIHEDINKVEIFGKDGSVSLIDMNTMASQAYLSSAFN